MIISFVYFFRLNESFKIILGLIRVPRPWIRPRHDFGTQCHSPLRLCLKNMIGLIFSGDDQQNLEHFFSNIFIVTHNISIIIVSRKKGFHQKHSSFNSVLFYRNFHNKKQVVLTMIELIVFLITLRFLVMKIVMRNQFFHWWNCNKNFRYHPYYFLALLRSRLLSTNSFLSRSSQKLDRLEKLNKKKTISNCFIRRQQIWKNVFDNFDNLSIQFFYLYLL